MKPIYLHAGRERRLLRGHRWIFSNEISSPLSDFDPGSWVEVFSSKGASFGSGYINPKSLIAVRLVCPPGQEPTKSFFVDLLRKAVRRREAIYPDSVCYRIVYSESDGFPGLVVDRYGEVFVYQINTLGMALLEHLLQEVMLEVLSPKTLLYRNDTSIRTLEGLPLEKGIAYGSLPEPYWVTLDESEFGVDFLEGQKTGLFLDQRENRRALKRWAKGRKVLDLFCYDGGWSLAAVLAGAEEATGVDQSSKAIARARANASRNGCDSRCTFLEGDVFSYMKKVEKGRFDLIILDPPAFAKSKSALVEAQKGYIDLNRRALLALNSGGMLVTCSCSYHMNEELMQEVILKAAQAAGRQLRLLEARGQAPDHPMLLAMPETRYLKCFFLEVV